MCMLGGASEGRRALARGERGGRMAAGGGEGGRHWRAHTQPVGSLARAAPPVAEAAPQRY